jgi:uncharacterized membrane protein
MKEKLKAMRLWEIDLSRGFLVILMVVFHFAFDFVNFQIIKIDLYSGFWWLFPRFIAASFIFVSGLSLTLSYNRVKKNLSYKQMVKKYIIRGASILGLGLIITFVTYIIYLKTPERAVIFGILHLIGFSVIAGFFLVKFRMINLFLGFLVLCLGIYLNPLRFNFYWLAWLGFWPESFYPVDYEPVLPWFSFFLFGLFTGNLIYKDGKRIFNLPDLSRFKPVRLITFLGRNSLIFYLAHRPIVMGSVYLLALALNK